MRNRDMLGKADGTRALLQMTKARDTSKFREVGINRM